jgi:hypothetical protein
MSYVKAATVAVSLIGNAKKNSGEQRASGIQSAAAQGGIDEQNKQLSAIQEMLAPFITGGQSAFSKQLSMLGIGGSETDAIQEIKNGPEFQALLNEGGDAIRANASATGGLRGGNTQAALAEFSPKILSQLLNDRFTRLGSLSTIGQNTAINEGDIRTQVASNIAELLAAKGAAGAGGAIAKGNRFGDTIGKAFGAVKGLF